MTRPRNGARFLCLFACYTRTYGTQFIGGLIPATVAVAPQSWVMQKRVPSVHCAALVERPTWIVVAYKSVICGLWHIAAVVAWVGVVRVCLGGG